MPAATRTGGSHKRGGSAEQWIKESKNAATASPAIGSWTGGRLQLFALADNLANFMRRLALREPVKHRALTTLREKPVEIGVKFVRHARYIVLRTAEAAVPRELFGASMERSR